MPQEPLKPRLVGLAEEVTDIRLEDPAYPPASQPDRQRIKRIMRRAARAKPLGKPNEVLLMDGVQHLNDRPLEDLVLKRRDPERALAPIQLGDEHPSSRLRPIHPSLDTSVQVPKVRLEILASIPAHLIDPRRGPASAR